MHITIYKINTIIIIIFIMKAWQISSMIYLWAH